MTRETAPCCGTCKFWSRAHAAEMGECRRHPPTAFVVPVQALTGPGMAVRAGFPPTPEQAWCGEYAETDHGEGEA